MKGKVLYVDLTQPSPGLSRTDDPSLRGVLHSIKTILRRKKFDRKKKL